MEDLWRAKGLSEEEIRQKAQLKLERIQATRARTMALRKEREALSAGLGDAVSVAKDIAKRKRELDREFKLSPLKGVQSRSTILKRQQKRQEALDRARERAYNPKVKGLAGVPGLEVSEDGTIGLEDLRKQRPDIFDMKPVPIEGQPDSGRMRKINEKMKAAGRKDRYDHLLND